MTITLKVSDKTKKEMNEFFDDYKREKTPPYAVFQADDADTVITVYESGKAVFQGRDADLSSQFWIERERHNNPLKKVEVTNSDNKSEKDKKEIYIDPKIYNSTSIGSDEVGTGDYFGPIVVCASYVKKDDISFLEDLGVKDSKKMTDEKILGVVPKFIKRIPYECIILSNKEYNEKYNNGYNMNKLKAILHNKVLGNLKNKINNYDYIVVDQFAEKYVYFSYLKDFNNVVRDITFLTKGEDKCLSVACASLISRYVFLKEFAKISESVNELLPKGASTMVDEKAVKIVKKYGFEKLNEIAKVNFKNTEKIKSLLN
ncbi:MAG TPA: ribonuclease HIII [Bacilli bacterium]|nr:ribonuclease HIII [Bacilli bacterium]